ncbi:MAG TPA: aminoacyl-tRNA hydrolase [Actinomycetota bacterium]|nr:aminoacyl-tRNA hydrolase [Actinomycetota bacterium]
MSLFRRSARPTADRWLIVGLGNPGDKYAQTRHNLGAMVVANLAERAGAALKSHKSGCLVAEADVGGDRVVLARPTTYMNESGRPVGELARWFKVEPARVIVVHDELDIPFEEVRIKSGGGTAGHNGLRSVASHLGTKDFARVRVGIGRPRTRDGAVGHVLDSFSAVERKALPDVVESAADAVEAVVAHGVERAMNLVNTRA